MAEDQPEIKEVQQQRNCCCASFPDFGAVCLFIDQFGELLGLHPLNINNLKAGFEDDSEEVPDLIQGLHVYLLRRLKKNVPGDRWERELVKFCMSYNQWDAWELEERGYARLKVQTRLSIIRNLLEAQFENNQRFQERIRAEIAEEDLRRQCYGRDSYGLCYWVVQDDQLTINVYQVEQDDTDGASWRIAAKDRDELEVLIGCLKENKPIPSVLAQQMTRSETPLSMMSSATGTAAFNHSRTATPTKFAFDRATPVKAQEADTDSADSKPDVAADVKHELAEQDVKETVTEDTKVSEVKDVQDVELERECNTAVGEGVVKEEPSTNEMMAEGDDTGSRKQESEDGDMAEDVKLPFTSSATDLSMMSVASDLTPGMDTPSGQVSETDSEDNIPLSQLKKSCVLMNQTRRSLMKAKKKHEKKKWKEMIKKKKERGSRKGHKVTDVVTDSPKSSQRSSGRQRVPIFQDMTSEESSDPLSDDDYMPKQGRNARRQAKRSAAVHLTTHEELSSEVDNDDTPCFSCGKYNQPHLILLCDKCDAGWHTGCVKPPLFYIPDGDWHCPNCEHAMLIAKLEADLEKLDELIQAREAKKKRMERQEKHALANGINPSNIISDFGSPTDRPARERKHNKRDEYDYSSEDDFVELPIKRSCRTRKNVNYTFQQYEQLINSAIGKKSGSDPTLLAGVNSSLVPSSRSVHPGRPPPGQSRGKDISNLLDGTNLSINSDEENEAELNESKEEKTSLGKENVNSSTRTVPAAKKKRTSKFNDMDADSAGEEDGDYMMSDEAADEYGPSGVSEESCSDDAWTPGGGNRKSGKGRSRRRGGRVLRDNVGDFICDEEEESEPEKRKTKRSYARPRRAAAATQATSRRKRAPDFGFTSSEESLATTPGSSSTDEEEHAAKRRLNKWNQIKTYSGGQKPVKKSPVKKKKRQRVKEYNSDKSTEQETSDSEEEYRPIEEQVGEASAAEVETDAEGSDEGVHRVNNRLDSSSDEEKPGSLSEQKPVADNGGKEDTEMTSNMQNNICDSKQTGESHSSVANSSEHKEMIIDAKALTTIPQALPVNGMPTAATATEMVAEHSTVATDMSSTVVATINNSLSSTTSHETVMAASHQTTLTNSQNITAADVKAPTVTDVRTSAVKVNHTSPPTDKNTSSTAPSPVSLMPAGDSDAKSLKPLQQTTTSPSKVIKQSLSQEKSLPPENTYLEHPSQVTSVSSLAANSNNNNSFRTDVPTSPVVSRPLPSYPVRPMFAPPAYQPGYGAHHPYNSFPQAVQQKGPGLSHAPPQAMTMAASSGDRPPDLSALNGQSYYHRLPQPYTSQRYTQEQYAQSLNTGSNAYHTPYSLPPPVLHQHSLSSDVSQPLAPPHQSSNAFMVDNILHSSQNTVNYGSTAVDGPGEEDDEMSSYMNMANSIASAGNDNS